MSEIPNDLLAEIVEAQSSGDSEARLRRIDLRLRNAPSMSPGERFLHGQVLGLLKEYREAIEVLSAIREGDGGSIYRAAQLDMVVYSAALSNDSSPEDR